ncbi:MAG TPA: hypothetical protein VN280_22415 [Variovorax sp.]|nr:hypothetical protein [Variovorax sp.]
MSRIFCSQSGASNSVSISLVVYRWGAGAHPGQYHMFLAIWDFRAGLPLVSAQCVVDDFGDLVEVPR